MTQAGDVSVELVWILLKAARELGSVPADFEPDPPLPRHPEARIPLQRLNTIWEELAGHARDPNFGVRLGAVAGSKLPGGHLLLSLMQNSPNLRRALETFSRYHGLMTDAVRLKLEAPLEEAVLAVEPLPHLKLGRHHAQAVLSFLKALLDRLSDGELPLAEARFSQAAPACVEAYLQAFACPVRFHQKRDELVFPQAALSRPIFLADPGLLQALERHALGRLSRLELTGSWSERVGRDLARCLLRGEGARLETVASRLAVSPRTLQKSLRAEGTSYQLLLDQLRRELALGYLNRPDVSLCDLALLLGFSEQSSFQRAFRRWMGTTPGGYRAQAAGSSISPASQ